MLGYDLPPYRPPNESGSVLIRATRGCPWNRCYFCFMYRSMRFEVKSFDEVCSDIDRAVQLHGKNPKYLFIGDSNSVVSKHLPDILRYVRAAFPQLERVTSYARAKSLKRLGVEKLKELYEAGLTRVHIGLESGDPVTLERLSKGTSDRDMIHGAIAAKEAGIEVSAYVLLGAGGQERSKEHAVETARVLNAMEPDFIRFRTLTIQPGTPLWDMKDTGDFIPVSPIERIEETLTIISNLNCLSAYIASDHVTNNLWLNGSIIYTGIEGTLGEDKDEMRSYLRKTLDILKRPGGTIMDSTLMMDMGYITGL